MFNVKFEKLADTFSPDFFFDELRGVSNLSSASYLYA